MSRVAVIGHFGIGLDLANGQTIKTKIVTEEVEKYCKEKAVIIDTHGGIRAIIPVIIGSIKSLVQCENVILMLTENGLKVSVPVLFLFNKFFHRRLHYVVVGGWLPEFLKKQQKLVEMLKSFHMIYVETYNMKKLLEEMGFGNIVVMPNCKSLKIVQEPEKCTKPYKLCTFSRVMKEKGIEDAVNAVISANKQLGKEIYHLDIYGQIDSKQVEWFEKLKKSFPRYIKYCGLIKFDQSVETLKTYFALLFPTYYIGEGFAGTAIDAFSAGVPVLASDWKYNNEVIKEGINGGLFEAQNVEGLAMRLIDIAKNPRPWLLMREQCIIDAHIYKPENVMRVLLKQLI
nr:glycosyltransferase [uncultured Blautia sp.]